MRIHEQRGSSQGASVRGRTHASALVAKLLCALALLAAVAVGTGCSVAPGSSVMIGDKPPKVALPDLNGQTVTVPNDLKGRVVILHFWTEGCRSCMSEMPAMQSLYTAYKDKGFAIVAVNVGQSPEAVKKSVKKLKIGYTVVLDQEGKVSRTYGVNGLPRTFFLDRDGVIRYKLFSEANEEMLKQLVIKLL